MRARLAALLNGTVAAAIVTVIGYFDDVTIGPIVIALAAALPALATFAITAVAYSLVQYWASIWLIRNWNAWIGGDNGRRFESRLRKWRQGRFTRRLVAGVTSGSTFWYFVASLLLATVDIVAIWSVSAKEPLPGRRLVLSAAVYGTWCAALWTAVGYGIHVGIDAA